MATPGAGGPGGAQGALGEKKQPVVQAGKGAMTCILNERHARRWKPPVGELEDVAYDS